MTAIAIRQGARRTDFDISFKNKPNVYLHGVRISWLWASFYTQSQGSLIECSWNTDRSLRTSDRRTRTILILRSWGLAHWVRLTLTQASRIMWLSLGKATPSPFSCKGRLVSEQCYDQCQRQHFYRSSTYPYHTTNNHDLQSWRITEGIRKSVSKQKSQI